MSESDSINPYAPASQVATAPWNGNPLNADTDGIVFHGSLDVDQIRKTDHISLWMGLAIGIGFAGLLLFSGSVALFDAPARRSNAMVLIVAGLVTSGAVWGFIAGQTKRPLRKFRWMSGELSGVLWPDRIDIRWQVGEASLMIPRNNSPQDYVNRNGRLYVCRGVRCFIPASSVDPAMWRQLKTMHAVEGDPKRVPADPPLPPSEAERWEENLDQTRRDYRLHRHATASPAISRFVFSSGLIMGVIALNRPDTGVDPVVIVAGTACLVGGVFWLLRMVRKRPFGPPMPLMSGTLPMAKTPGYCRWIDEEHVLVGYADGWIRLPWDAFVVAKASSHGLHLSLDRKSTDTWFLERGQRTVGQWVGVIEFVRQRVPTKTFGAIRHHLAKD